MQSKPIMKNIPIELLRLEEKYDQSSYTLAGTDCLTPEALQILLQLHPIIVQEKRQKLIVVYGRRLYHLAAFSLPPTEAIPVIILDKHTSADHLRMLQYFDVAVIPLLFRRESSPIEIYRSIDLPGVKEKVWTPQIRKSKRAFAHAIRVAPAALSTSVVDKHTNNSIGQLEVVPNTSSE